MSKSILVNYLESLEHNELTGDYIRHATNNRVDIVSYHDLPKYASLLDLFDGDHKAVILLLERSYNVGHYVVLIYNEAQHQLWYFDPYGFTLAKDLKFSAYDDPHVLPNMIARSGMTLRQSNYKLQRDLADIETCGRHCILRCMFYFMDNETYGRMVTQYCRMRNMTPDEFVTITTMLADLQGFK